MLGSGASGGEERAGVDLATFDRADGQGPAGVEGNERLERSPTWARRTNNVMHWVTGLAWGAQYGLVAASVRLPRHASGPLFGAFVFADSYVVLPLAKL